MSAEPGYVCERGETRERIRGPAILAEKDAPVEAGPRDIVRRRVLSQGFEAQLLIGVILECGWILQRLSRCFLLLIETREDGFVIGGGFGSFITQVMHARQEIADVRGGDGILKRRELAERATGGEVILLCERRVAVVIESHATIAAFDQHGIFDERLGGCLGFLELVRTELHLGEVTARRAAHSSSAGSSFTSAAGGVFTCAAKACIDAGNCAAA